MLAVCVTVNFIGETLYAPQILATGDVVTKLIFFLATVTSAFALPNPPLQCMQKQTPAAGVAFSSAADALFNSERQPLDLTPTETYVRKLYLSLTGAPKPVYDPHFQRAVKLVDAGQPLQAAQLIVTDPGF